MPRTNKLQGHRTTRNPPLPGLNVIGLGYFPIDVNNPFDLDAIPSATKVSLIDLRKDQLIPVHGTPWSRPESVDYFPGGLAINVKETYRSGSELVREFDAGASISAGYLSFSGSGGAKYAAAKAIRQESSYHLAANGNNSFTIKMTVPLEKLLKNNAPLIEALDKLSLFQPGTNPGKDITDQYRRFFQHWGSHLITGGRLGTGFRTSVYMTCTDEDSFNAFKAAADLHFQGLAKADAGVNLETNYKEITSSWKATSNYVGGDLKTKASISNHPYDSARMTAWENSQPENPALLQIELFQLWDALPQHPVAPCLKSAYDEILLGGLPAMVQSDNHVANFWDKNSPLVKLGRNSPADSPAEDFFEIKFKIPFPKPPTIVLSMTGFDTGVGLPRVGMEVIDTTADGFKARVFTWYDTHVYSVRVNWLAYAS